jgi:hypothetical protein
MKPSALLEFVGDPQPNMIRRERQIHCPPDTQAGMYMRVTGHSFTDRVEEIVWSGAVN